jgi:preprotein translocase subunit SecA
LISFVDKVLRFGEGKKLKQLEAAVAKVAALESDISSLSDAALRAKTDEFKQRYQAARVSTTWPPRLLPSSGKQLDARRACVRSMFRSWVLWFYIKAPSLR